MMLRWLTARGYRVTLLLAVLGAAFHAANELRVLAGGAPNFLQRLELTALDVKFAFRGERTPDPWRVAVVAIDERALQRFGPLPWRRTIHAELVDKLTALKAGAIAFDMTFDRPSAGADADLRALLGAYEGAGLGQAPERLRGEAERLHVIAARSPHLRTRGRQMLRESARSAVDVAERLDRFQRAMAQHDGAPSADPDAAFAAAIRRSGRVVLGAVAYSQQEAEALGAGRDGRGLGRVASSTIATMSIDDGAGLTRFVDAKGHIGRGLYRRYFDVLGPTPELSQATPHFGLINASPDVDGVNRRMPLVCAIKGSDVLLPGLGLKSAQVTLGASETEIVGAPEAPAADLLRLGTTVVPTELGASMTLDWPSRFDPKRFPIISVVDVLDGVVDAERIRGRAVFVAATAIGTHDQRVTPTGPAVPGVYIHATLAQNILEGRRLSRPPYVVLMELVLLILIGLAAGVLMARFRLWGQLGTTLALALGWLALNQLMFVRGLVAVTVLPLALIFLCLLSMSMWSYLIEQRERRQTRRAFAQYLSPAVMERVLAEPEEYLKLGGRRYEATVLFSDIRGFTTISEALTPEDLGKLLNEYMTPMTDIVFRHQGTLDKYIGDAVMAFWGAPVEQPDHPLRACKAAIEMQAELTQINQRFRELGLPTVSIGIGLSSGPMTIGNMGSDDHFAYTALGDRVNLGARLEGQTKDYGVGIIISEATQRSVAGHMRCRELGAIRVKGKSEPVGIYELVGSLEQTEDRAAFIDAFHRGLTLFQARKWDAAIGQFMQARALNGPGGDKASDLYIQWSEDFRASPPPPEWDGVHTALRK